MPSLSPRLTLLLLLFLTLALVILGGGWRLGRREESVRLDRDREVLRRFAIDAQANLVFQWLEADRLESGLKTGTHDRQTFQEISVRNHVI